MTDQPENDSVSTSAEPETGAGSETQPTSRFPELEALQDDVARRIRDNQKFLESFMDDEFVDDDPESAADDTAATDDFEEL
ncbi:MAG: hypothetical protein IBX47_13545 [Desulfuromonadales bacterium]|nr:hypothetical protein [Desulfuromonadales bacterium]